MTTNEDAEGKLQMRLLPRKNSQDSLFQEGMGFQGTEILTKEFRCWVWGSKSDPEGEPAQAESTQVFLP